jgi:glycosyltransferase involved in cell wall biosynthesis
VDIVIVSTNDWNGYWFQRQEFATRFAAEGHRVFFINRIPQRIPGAGRIIRRLFAEKKSFSLANPVPEGVRVLSIRLLPPLEVFRGVNRLFLRRFWGKWGEEEKPKSPLLITYQPSYSVLDLSRILKPQRTVYINTHNYDEDPACPKALLKSEKLLTASADVLLADSQANQKRLTRYNPAVTVGRAMPGVDYARFSQAFRGDEARRVKKIVFFGDIGKHLDLTIYNSLAEDFEVVFIGRADPLSLPQISPRITICPPVKPSLLPEALKEADVLTIFYRISPYIENIIPAKLFECLATGKPVFVSNLPEAEAFQEGLYYYRGEASAVIPAITGDLSSLAAEETPAKVQARKDIAGRADWVRRFEDFKSRIF